jgi:hypothetical protein
VNVEAVTRRGRWRRVQVAAAAGLATLALVAAAVVPTVVLAGQGGHAADSAWGHRLRVTIARGCPASIAGYRDVRNPAGALTGGHFVPPHPSEALICRFSPIDGAQGPGVSHGKLYEHSHAGSSPARRLAADLNRMPQRTGDTACPADIGSYDVLVFGYAGRPDVDIWYASSGCPTLSNGETSTGDFSSAFADFDRTLNRLAPRKLR